jgi:hypothetical protein
MKFPSVDKVDLILLIGLFLLGAGLWLYDPRIAMIVVGTIVSLLAIWSALRG